MKFQDCSQKWKSGSFLVIGFVLFCLSGCGLFNPDEEFEERGSVLWFGESSVSIPDTVFAGEVFEVSILTSLNGCDEKGPTPVEHLSIHSVKVAPRDNFYIGKSACPAINFSENHEVALSFAEPGEALVVVHARVWNVEKNDSVGYREFPVVVLER